MQPERRDGISASEPVAIRLPVRRAGIDTYRQPVLFLRQGCLVCRAEGFVALARVKVECDGREVVVTREPGGTPRAGPGTSIPRRS